MNTRHTVDLRSSREGRIFLAAVAMLLLAASVTSCSESNGNVDGAGPAVDGPGQPEPDGPAFSDLGPSFDTGDGDTTSGPGSFLPLVVGARYEYNFLSDNQFVRTAANIVSAREPLDPADTGKPPADCYKIEYYEDDDPHPLFVRWWERQGDRVVQHREDYFDWWEGNLVNYSMRYYLPPSVVVSDAWSAGSTPTDDHDEWWKEDPDEQWRISTPEVTLVVEALDEPVTVPAGTFSCLKFTRTIRKETMFGDYTTIVTTYWFARGVGLVKTSERYNDTSPYGLELTSYSLP
jgi:hypothetical protein